MILKFKQFIGFSRKKIIAFSVLTAINLLFMLASLIFDKSFNFDFITNNFPAPLSIAVLCFFYFPSFVVWCFGLAICGGMGCPNGIWLETFIIIAGYIVLPLITWFYICVLITMWNKIFGLLKNRRKFYEIIVAFIILFFIVILGVLLPII